MISVMNNECEYNRGSNPIGESGTRDRVSEPGVDSSNGEGQRDFDLEVPDKVRVSSMAPDYGAQKGEVDARVSEVGRSEDVGVRVCEGEARVRVIEEFGSVGGVGKEMESRAFQVEDESNKSADLFHQNDRREDQDDCFYAENVKEEHVEEGRVSEYNSLLSEFDDFVANENNVGLGMSRALSFGLEVGDMVWGKVKSHPWWPGHIFNEAFASPSVRRTRREGFVLVAFFGDSSYGWFDPAELIPFDLHYAEKSRQTNSRTFVKAVEEAVDEMSRRRGLALACKCRNPYNFRVTSVPGYYAVDVPDYEPGGVYSATQIKKGRDSFKPRETLAFVKQLATVPRGSDESGIDFHKDKATVIAYRKAVFEEFDETYAQAFGVQPGRPSRVQVDLDQPVKQPPLAPLSGPLVIAEALGGGKSSSKPMKIKDHSKKDRYLFKRREEPINSKTHQINLGQASSCVPSAFVDVSTATGDYVMQKRVAADPVKQILTKQEEVAYVSKDSATSGLDGSGKGAAHSGAHGHQDIPDMKTPPEKGKGSLPEIKDRLGPGDFVGPKSPGFSGFLEQGALPRVMDDTSQSMLQERETKTWRSYEDWARPELSFATRVEGSLGTEQVKDGRGMGDPTPIDVKRSSGFSTDGVKKAKILKRTAGDLSSENSVVGEKKKKRRKVFGTEMSSDHPQKRLATGKVGMLGGKLVGKSTQVGLAQREGLQVERQKRSVGASNSSVDSVVSGIGNTDVELPQLLSDLQSLALDPFHGVERNRPGTVRQFFLRFRSLVYQKSLVLSTPTDSESADIRPTKYTSGVESPPGEHVRDLPCSKPVKSVVRPDDPTKAGRKRGPSDRQEEMAAKKLKKINAIKSLAAEKKGGQKTSESLRGGEGRESVVLASQKPSRPDPVKKAEPPAKTGNPTMLVMKFPPCTSLPSVAELKARFARFGPLDQSGLRVFWKSSTCRVMFLHKRDAEAAYKFAVGNNSLFGNVNVRCHIREMGVTVEGSESGNPTEILQAKDPAVVQRAASGIQHQSLLKPAVQLKSCLKRSSGEEPGQVTGGGTSKGTPRVKFMLGGEESSREEQLMVGNRNNFNNNATIAGGGAPSSVAMDINSKNFRKVIPPSPSPILPLPQFAKSPHNNLHHPETASRNTQNPINIPSAPSATTVDISQQFLSLLTRCNDVVTKVTGLLGYVPYHPL